MGGELDILAKGGRIGACLGHGAIWYSDLLFRFLRP